MNVRWRRRFGEKKINYIGGTKGGRRDREKRKTRRGEKGWKEEGKPDVAYDHPIS